ncbi:MAG: TolC family protein [Thermodesulfobacteriota bacterium]
MIKKITLCVSIVALCSCTLIQPTDPYRPVKKPLATVSAQSIEIPAAGLPEAPLDLRQAIAIALANNPDVGATSWEVAAARYRQDQVMADRLPRLSAVGVYTHHLDPQRLIPAHEPNDPAIYSEDIVSGDLVFSMPLFTAGRLINQVKAAELLQMAAGHRLGRSRTELVFNVSSVFFNTLAQRYVVESLDFSRRALKEHLRLVEALVAAQKAARVDLLRTEVRLADIQQRLVREENVMAIQQRVLANLLGLEGQADKITLQGELELEKKEPVPDFEAALAAAYSLRDDYHAARAALEAQAYKVDAARAGHWPTVSLQGAYGSRGTGGSTTGAGDESDDVGRVGVTVEIPLFEGGNVNARILEQRADLAAAQERLRKIELQIRMDIETAMLNVDSSRERIEAGRKAIEQAQESLRIEQQKYELGKGTILDVLDAQSALLNSQTNYYRALADHHTALAQLRLAMGEKK